MTGQARPAVRQATTLRSRWRSPTWAPATWAARRWRLSRPPGGSPSSSRRAGRGQRRLRLGSPAVGAREVLTGLEVVALRRSGSDRVLAALYGPTSAGKTALAVEVAVRIERELGRKVVVISAVAPGIPVHGHRDQQDDAAQRRGIRHELIDVTEPVRKLSSRTTAAGPREHRERVRGRRGAVRRRRHRRLRQRPARRLAGRRGGAARAALRRDFPRSMADDAYAMLRRLNRDSPPGCTLQLRGGDQRAGRDGRRVGDRPPPGPADGPAPVVLGVDPARAR